MSVITVVIFIHALIIHTFGTQRINIADDDTLYHPSHQIYDIMHPLTMKNSSLVIKLLIDLMYRRSNGSVTVADCVLLKAWFTQIEMHPSITVFQRIYNLMQDLFPTRSLFTSSFEFFYAYFYQEKIKFISNNTLEIVDVCEENKNWLLFKVGTINTINTNISELFDLKMYKSMSFQNICLNEEHILNKINEFSAAFDIIVPKRIESIGGVIIDCKSYTAILMESVDGYLLSDGEDIPDDFANFIYLQLAPTIKNLGNIGIGHNNINPNKIIIDKNSKCWLTDFSNGLNLNHLTMTELQNEFVGTWLYYAPHLLLLNQYRKKLLKSIQRRKLTTVIRLSPIEQEQWANRLIDANLYSLQSVLLSGMLKNSTPSNKICQQQMEAEDADISRIFQKNNYVIKKRIVMHLNNIWGIRFITAWRYQTEHDENDFLHDLLSLVAHNTLWREKDRSEDDELISFVFVNGKKTNSKLPISYVFVSLIAITLMFVIIYFSIHNSSSN